MTVGSFAYELKDKATEYLPNILHGAGSALSVVSGMPSLGTNSAYGLNVAVGVVLGLEGLSNKKTENYQFSSKYDRLVGALRGCANSRNLKSVIGIGLGILPIGLYMQGHRNAALENALFDLGLWISVAGSEIERRRISKELDCIG